MSDTEKQKTRRATVVAVVVVVVLVGIVTGYWTYEDISKAIGVGGEAIDVIEGDT